MFVRILVNALYYRWENEFSSVGFCTNGPCTKQEHSNFSQKVRNFDIKCPVQHTKGC